MGARLARRVSEIALNMRSETSRPAPNANAKSLHADEPYSYLDPMHKCRILLTPSNVG